MKKHFPIFLFITLFSCTDSSEIPYDKNGFAFTVPSGWEITNEENIDSGTGYSLTCEKRGWWHSGVVMISWINDSVPLNDMLDLLKKEYTDNWVGEHANPIFKPYKEETLKEKECLVLTYSMQYDGVSHWGKTYCFYGTNKTFYMLYQGADEDKAINNPGMEKIKETLLPDRRNKIVILSHGNCAFTDRCCCGICHWLFIKQIAETKERN